MANPELATDSRPIFFTEIEQFGGAERSALALARWLYHRGLPVHIVTYANRCNIASYAEHPLPVIVLDSGSSVLTEKVGTVARITALSRYLKARSGPAPKPLVFGYQPALHATVARARGFHTLMHDTPSLFVDPLSRTRSSSLRIALTNRVIARGLRSGGKTIVTSEYLREECRKDFGVEAHIARMGGLTAEDPASLFRIRPVMERLNMLSVCRIEANKRIDWMLHSLAELEQASPPLSSRIDWHLDLAGKGPLIAELTAQAEVLGIAARVHFHGFVSDDELQMLYDQAHLFLMPAVQGYGIPAIEALQRGIPVLLHRESGVSDILLDTPWVTVTTGGREQMTDGLRSAIMGVVEDQPQRAPLPQLPTEDEWASQVAHLCGWMV